MARMNIRFAWLLAGIVSLTIGTAIWTGTGVAGAAAPSGSGCSLTLSPTSGPVGTVVSITGSTETCGASGGGFGFIDEHAGTLISRLPAAGPFSFTFTIPSSMPSGDWFAAAQGYDGGGPVQTGPANFVNTMGAQLSATFDVTVAAPGASDYTTVMATGANCSSCVGGPGYDVVRSDGYLATLGGAPNAVGNAGDLALSAPIVDAAFTPGDGGYWMVGADGGVFTYGDARYFGSLPGLPAAQQPGAPVVGMAPTAGGGGYWEVTSSGDVYSFGDAAFHGSLGGIHLAAPIVGIAATPGGGGYWLVAKDGGVFAFGDAHFAGSLPALRLSLQGPVVGIASTPSGGGYWAVSADGGVYAFGDATFHGSANGVTHSPIVGLASTPNGGGYWIVAKDGGVFTYGDAPFGGSAT